ncbi:MAG: hypothetical protein H0M93_05690 [Methanophagales archaeon]|nr:hypothetical protein [Methanophagales archaeon]
MLTVTVLGDSPPGGGDGTSPESITIAPDPNAAFMSLIMVCNGCMGCGGCGDDQPADDVPADDMSADDTPVDDMPVVPGFGLVAATLTFFGVAALLLKKNKD